MGNQAAALCYCHQWTAAVESARAAVAANGTFIKARIRLGSAYLGAGQPEQAYDEFVRALQLDGNSPVARRGRETCLAELPRWCSKSAQRRFSERFGYDLVRPVGTVRVYAISDVHFDHRCNEDWVHRIDDFKFRDDVLIVAGNLCDSKHALVRGLIALKAKFRRVFFVPGNHELWLHPSEAARYPDSISKLLAIFDACDELGVDIAPAAVCADVFVVPLLSWYNSGFDIADPFPDWNLAVDSYCKWPLDPDHQVWRWMLALNEEHLRHPYHGTVITFSHFLPRPSLPFESRGKAVKAMGCEGIDTLVRKVRSSIHIYGHSTRRHVTREDGVIYANHFHGQERGKLEQRAKLLCVYDGYSAVHDEVEI